MNIRWPVALAGLFVALLAWYVFYTQSLVETLHEDSQLITSIFAIVQEGIQDTTGLGTSRPGESGTGLGLEITLDRLQQRVIESGMPLVITVDSVIVATANLPPVDFDDPREQARLREFVRDLDARHPPIAGAFGQQIHFGDTPQVRALRWQPYILAGGLLITSAIGFLVIRYQRRAEAERAWTTMARELAHQLGTPISSLQGWLELMRMPAHELPGGVDEKEVSDGIEEDLVRLERISRRFELIGREPPLERLGVRDVVRELEEYLQARLPRLTKGVLLVVDIPGNLPDIMGNRVLLTWALENLVKNALDAMAGQGGEIRIRARAADPGWLSLWVSDTGPGVPLELRDRIFEPGISGKSHGWGVGLTLSRRIIRGVHEGRIALLEGTDRGATFEIRLPIARA